VSAFPDLPELVSGLLDDKAFSRWTSSEAVGMLEGMLHQDDEPLGQEPDAMSFVAEARQETLLFTAEEGSNLHFAQVELAIAAVAPMVDIQGHRWLQGRSLLEISFNTTNDFFGTVDNVKEAVLRLPGIGTFVTY